MQKMAFFNYNRQPWISELNAHLEAQRRREAELARKAAEAQRQKELEALLQAQTQARAMILNQAFLSPPKQDTSKHKSYKRDRFSKAIFAEPALKILRAE